MLLLLQDSLQEQMMHGSFVLDGRDDILNTAIGRPEHLGRVRVAGTGVIISQYFEHASRCSNTSLTSISPQQLVNIIGNLKEEWRREVEEENKNLNEAWRREVEEENKLSLEIMKQGLKKAIKIKLSQMESQHPPHVEASDIQVLVARVSTKGSFAETLLKLLQIH